MTGPTQPAVRLYAALIKYAESIAGTDDCGPYRNWLQAYGDYIWPLARTGQLPVWQEEIDGELPKIANPLFSIEPAPPHGKRDNYFDIGDAVGSLHGFTRSLPVNSMEQQYSATFTDRITRLLEAMPPHPQPENLACLNQVQQDGWLSKLIPEDDASDQRINVNAAIQFLGDISAADSKSPSMRFFAERCQENLLSRLMSENPVSGLDISASNGTDVETALWLQDYGKLNIPLYRGGLFAVIGHTVDILEMNQRAFAVPFAGFDNRPVALERTFWALYSFTLNRQKFGMQQYPKSPGGEFNQDYPSN